MKSSALSSVKDITEEELRTFLFQYPKTIVKYHSPVYIYGEGIMQIYNELSIDVRYNNICFVRINAHENPVALNAVKRKESPFVLTYHKGLLIDCSNVRSGEEVVSLLNKLINN